MSTQTQTGTATTTLQTFTFSPVQNVFKLVNNGETDIHFNVGAYTNKTLHAYDTFEARTEYDSFDVITDVGTSDFTATMTNDVVDIGDLNRRVEDLGINVSDFGAVGDGVTDDTIAIQTALENITMGETLIIPSGDFLMETDITILIPSNIDIICRGRIVYNSSRNSSVFRINNEDNVNIYDLTMDGGAIDSDNYSNSCLALEIKSSRNINIVRPNIQNVTGDGVYIGRDTSLGVVHCEDVKILDGNFYNTKRNAIATVSGKRISIEGNTITSNTTGVWNYSCAIDIEPNVSDDVFEGIKIKNNYLDCVSGPLKDKGLIRFSIGSGITPSIFANIEISNNELILYNTPDIGIPVGGAEKATNVKITDNVIHGDCQVGVQLYRCGNNLEVSKNIIDSSSESGILISYNGNDIRVENNNVTTVDGRGIYFTKNVGENYNIRNNNIEGTSIVDEAIFVYGENTVTNVVMENNIITSSNPTSLRTFQVDRVKVVQNELSENLVMTSTTNVFRVGNTIDGQFPLQIGTTAERISMGNNVDPTHSYYDTTLGYNVWYNGTSWVDGTGTIV